MTHSSRSGTVTERERKPLIYIAGPYTRPDPIENTRKAIAAGDEIVKLGGVAVIPHLSLLWHLVSPQPVEEWYERDLDLLTHCHALVRLPGPSSGADREQEYADALGLTMFYRPQLATVQAWIDAWKAQ